MDDKKITKISKRLSLVLRHQPQLISIKLNAQGWIEVDKLLEAFSENFFPLNKDELDVVVENNNKKRFAFSEDGKMIRASQGHSIDVDLGYEAQEPPPELFHGTAARFLESIKAQGLIKQKRHHVHLSSDQATALNVGQRHGKAVILVVKAGEMYEAGMPFFRSKNGVWLTDSVPLAYIQFPKENI